MTAPKNILLKKYFGNVKKIYDFCQNLCQYVPFFKQIYTINCVDGISFYTTHLFPQAIVNMRLLPSQDGLQMYSVRMNQLH
jgi:hypothetical protein